MYKNKLQELSQRSCFNLPSYTCIREGPDHAPRFKATVNFNGEVFESVTFCSTLRQAEHSAAEVALNSLTTRGSSCSLAARILDETGVYKNLLQEISQRVGAALPRYSTFRSGVGHLPVFTGMVEIGGIVFRGEDAKNKKQAEKNAALAAWIALKQLAKETPSTETKNPDEQEQVSVARALLKYLLMERADGAASPNCRPPVLQQYTFQHSMSFCPQSSSSPTSKILPLINSNKTRPPEKCNMGASTNRCPSPSQPLASPAFQSMPYPPGSHGFHIHKIPAAGAAPYIPVRQLVMPYHYMAPSVSIRTAVPCFSAPYMPPAGCYISPLMHAGPAPVHFAAPITLGPRVPVFASTVKAKAPAINGNNPLARAVESKTTASLLDNQVTSSLDQGNESTQVQLHN